MRDVLREVTPLTSNDCFAIFKREKSRFDFPLHCHEYLEINLLMNAGGAQRIVGNHIGMVDDMELVCVGSNLVHGWFDHECDSGNIREVTIQFHQDLLNVNLLRRNQLGHMRTLFENFKRGILFSGSVGWSIAPRIIDLANKKGFTSILELFSILNELSLTNDYRLLSDAVFASCEHQYVNERINRVFNYMNTNFKDHITLTEAADIASMATGSFSRFIKTHTGNSFVDTLNEIRLGHVTRMLTETNFTVAEIAYKCGFNNMANFNRTFKSKKGLTPKEFRQGYLEKRVYI